MNRELAAYFFALLAVNGFVMYYVYIVADPTFQIVKQTQDIANDTNVLANNTNALINKLDQVLENEANQTQTAIEQNQMIIENQNNNTATLKQLIKENRINQDQAVAYLIQSMNQSNIIGNKTAQDIQRNIDRVGELQQNLSQARADQSKGIVKGFSYLLEDLDEDSDDMRDILTQLAESENITLSQATQKDEFKIQSENQTFAFPNGTEVSFRDLFVPAAFTLTSTMPSSADIENGDQEGHVSGFLGGPLIKNNTIPLNFGLLNRSNITITGNLTQ